MKLKFLAALLWLLVAMTGQVRAQETPVPKIELTAQAIDKFVATFPVLAERLSGADPEFDLSDMDSLIGQIGLMIEGDPSDSALDAIALSQGFSTFEEWGILANNIMVARLWAENPPDLAEISASEDEIRSMSDISEDEKNEMIQGLHEAVGLAQDQKPSDINIELVRAKLGKLDDLLGASE
jgi:hypothetical protein